MFMRPWFDSFCHAVSYGSPRFSIPAKSISARLVYVCVTFCNGKVVRGFSTAYRCAWSSSHVQARREHRQTEIMIFRYSNRIRNVCLCSMVERFALNCWWTFSRQQSHKVWSNTFSTGFAYVFTEEASRALWSQHSRQGPVKHADLCFVGPALKKVAASLGHPLTCWIFILKRLTQVFW